MVSDEVVEVSCAEVMMVEPLLAVMLMFPAPFFPAETFDPLIKLLSCEVMERSFAALMLLATLVLGSGVKKMRTAFLARTGSGTKRRKGWRESDFEPNFLFGEKSDEAFRAELGIFLKFLKVGEVF